MSSIFIRNKWLIYGGVGLLTLPSFHNVRFPRWGPPLKNAHLKTAIVTGATGNLGSAIAYQLAHRKVRVIMACRDMTKCKLIRRQIVLATSNNSVCCRHVDLEDIDSIVKFTEDISKTEPHIDILINSAAVRRLEQKELTKNGVEKNYFVNFLAPFLLTLKLLDKLKESAEHTTGSRIINITGSPKRSWKLDIDDINFETRKYKPEAAYSQSKLALAYFTILLDKFNREKRNKVFVYGMSPTTNNMSKSLYRPIGLYEDVMVFIKDWYSAKVDRVALPAVKCALAENLANTQKSGKLYGSFGISWGWGIAKKDPLKAGRVWNQAVQLLVEGEQQKTVDKGGG